MSSKTCVLCGQYYIDQSVLEKHSEPLFSTAGLRCINTMSCEFRQAKNRGEIDQGTRFIDYARSVDPAYWSHLKTSPKNPS